MAFNLKQLGDELKKGLQQGVSNVVNNFNQPRVVNNPQPLAPKIQQYFNPTSNNGSNFWSSPVAKGLSNIQGFVENPNTPLVNPVPQFTPFQQKATFTGNNAISNFGNKAINATKNLGNMAVNLPGGMVNSIVGKGVIAPTLDILQNTGKSINRAMGGNADLTPYEQLHSGASRLGYQIAGNYSPKATQALGIKQGIKQTLGNAASTADPLLNAYLLESGVGKVEKVGAAAKTLLGAIKEGAFQGGKYGLAFGGISGFESGRNINNNPEYALNLFTNVLGGTAGGAVLGGGIAGLSGFIANVIRAKKPNATDQEIVTDLNGYVRDRLGKFAKHLVGKSEAPVEAAGGGVMSKGKLVQVSPSKLVVEDRVPEYYKEIDKKLGIPENFDIKRIKFGAGVKEITPEGRAKLKDANAELYDAKNSSDLYQKIRNFAQRNSSNLDNPTKIKSELVKEFGEDPTITLYRGVNKVDRPLNVESDASSEIGKFWSPNPSHSELFARRGMPQGKAGEIYSVQVKASDLLNRNDVRISEGEVHLPDRLQQNAKIVKDFSVAQQPSIKAGLYDTKNYHWYNTQTKQFEPVTNAKPVEVIKGVDTFISRNPQYPNSTSEWVITEAKSGARVSGGRTQKAAIEQGQQRFANLKDLTPQQLVDQISSKNGISPMYRQSNVVQQQPLSVPPTKGIESMPRVMKTPELPKVGSETLPLKQPLQSQPLLSQTLQTPTLKIKQSGQALEDIIAQGRKQIGGKIEEPKTSFKQSVDSLYTQWVDRFNPIIQASQKAKGTLKLKGASLRPEFDPEYLVRRLTGAGGIADNQFKTQLEPIIKQVETAGIPKIDLDTYLANKRMAGFGQVGRDIYGVDPQKAGQIVNALETKYPNIGQFADQLYNYQNKGFQEMVDAGFISPENAKIIQGQNPDYAPLKRVMDEVNDYLGVPTRKTMQGSQPIAKIKGSTRQIESPLESIIGNTFSQRAAIEKNRVAKAIVGLQNIAGDMGFTRAPKSDLNTITIWNNGQKEYWNVGKDIADVAKGVNEEQMNLVLKVLQAPAALLRQGATGRNPEFMLPNILRDQLDAGVTSKYGYIPFVDYVSGLKSMITNDSIYQKWANSGAKIDLGEMSGKKSIQGYFDTATKKKGLFSFLGGALDTMGKYSEVPTRVGLFKKAYKKTGNDLIAALESRDATVDFARMGSKMKVANSIIPFLNVGVQGFDKLIRSVKSNPAKVLFNATLYGTAPAIATTIYNLTNHPKEYAEIPQYEKDSNFVLVKGRNANGTVDYLTFPKGNVLPTITNPIQSFIDYAYGNDQQSFKEMALQTLSSTLPVIGDGQSVNEIALKTIGSNIPQLFKPAAENVLNKSFYKYDPKKEQTKDIVPSYLQNKEPYQQTYKFTPQMYQKIGALINTSPLKVQNIMEGYLAGYSKIPAQIIEMATKTSNGENISPNEKTILRRFIKQTYPSSGTKPTVEKTTTPVMERLGLAAKASEMQPNMLKYTKDGKDQEVDLNKYFEYPTLDPKSALGKEAITRYKSSISNQVNKIYDAYQSGALTEQQASDYINQLSVAYDKTKKPKAPKKPKKITIKFSKYTPKKITIKRSSVRVSPTIKKPKKLKLNRKYTIKFK